MTRIVLSKATDGELIELFREIAIEQYNALQMDRGSEYKRLYRDMRAIEGELKSRPGDQRRSLEALFEHVNPQVRVMAAGAALAAVPDRAYAVLQKLSASGEYPQAADAGMLIRGIDDGSYTPD